MIKIELTQGLIALIDDEDAPLVANFKWFARKTNKAIYASAWVGAVPKRKMVHMHNLILVNRKPEEVVDHIDRNGLNNQKNNLRLATKSQNNCNRSVWGTSKYLGISVTKRKSGVFYRAFIAVYGKQMYLGTYKSPELAAQRYNEAAVKFHRKFAQLNVLPSTMLAHYDKDVDAIIIQPETKRLEFT